MFTRYRNCSLLIVTSCVVSLLVQNTTLGQAPYPMGGQSFQNVTNGSNAPIYNMQPYRSMGGWQVSQRDTSSLIPVGQFNSSQRNGAQAVNGSNNQVANFNNQVANFQSQPNLPILPNYGQPGGVGNNVNPNLSFPNGGNPNKNLNNLPNNNLVMPNALGNPNLQPNLPNAPIGGQADYGNQTLPMQTVSAGNDLRAVAPTSAAQTGGNSLRAAADQSVQTGFGTQINREPITTGLPYVTAPPQRGKHATSAYNGPMIQTVTYQQPIQPNYVPNAANFQPTLPQYQQPILGQPVQPTGYQCGAPGAAVVPPTITPNLTPNMYSSNNSGYSPIFSLGQENYNVLLGRGIIGQPTVYVPGQPVRNFFRYMSP